MKEHKINWKKILFFVVEIIVFVRVFYIIALGKLEREYELSAQVDLTVTKEVICENLVQEFRAEEKQLNCLELLFSNIAPDKEGEVEVCVRDGDTLLYQTDVSLDQCENGEWHNIYLNIPVVPEKTYQLTFHAKNCTQSPNMLLVENDHAAPESLAFRAGGTLLEGQAALQYGYMRSPIMADRLVNAGLYMMFLAVFAWFMEYCGVIWQWAKNQRDKLFLSEQVNLICLIAELFFCLVIVNSGGVSLQEPTKVALYLISACCAWNFPGKWTEVSRLSDHMWKKIVMLCLYGYGAFALVGQRLFIYPLNLPVTFSSLFVFAAALLWMIPVLDTVICGICFVGRWSGKKENGQMSTALFVTLILCFLLLPAALNLYANNPGMSSWDTVDTLVVSARHLHGIQDWHPAFYCMVLRAIISVWDSTYAVIFVQYFFWAYVMGEGLLFFRKQNVNEKLLLIAALLAGTNAGNFLHLNTIWKDIPYTLSLVWTVILLAKLSFEEETYKKRWYVYLELLIALVGLYFYRKNGVVSFAVIGVAMLAVLYRNVKVWVTLVLTAVLIILIQGPVYTYFEVESSGRTGMYIGLGQDILGVYYTNGEISEETMQMVNVMTSYNNAEYSYDPTWSYQSYDLDVAPADFIKNYLNTFVKNPMVMTKAVIARMDAQWDIFQGHEAFLGCVNRLGTMDGQRDWNDYYPPRRYNSLYPRMARFTTLTANNQCLNALFWRSGIRTLISLVLLVVLVLKGGKQKYLLLFVPPASHILGLLLSTGWADFRYYWPMNLISLFLFLAAVAILGRNRQEDRQEKNVIQSDTDVFSEQKDVTE